MAYTLQLCTRSYNLFHQLEFLTFSSVLQVGLTRNLHSDAVRRYRVGFTNNMFSETSVTESQCREERYSRYTAAWQEYMNYKCMCTSNALYTGWVSLCPEWESQKVSEIEEKWGKICHFLGPTQCRFLKKYRGLRDILFQILQNCK